MSVRRVFAPRREAARVAAVQALYRMDLGGASFSEALRFAESARMGESDSDVAKADRAHARDVISGVMREQRAIDEALDDFLAQGDRSLSRCDALMRSVLRAGAYEALFRSDVPLRSALSEYVRVASLFFSDSEVRFANAALDGASRSGAGTRRESSS